MQGFDLKNDQPEIPEHFKALCQGRMVRYVHPSGVTRPAVVVDVVDQGLGLVELQVFAGEGLAMASYIDETTGRAGVYEYDAKGVAANSWHWPPRQG